MYKKNLTKKYLRLMELMDDSTISKGCWKSISILANANVKCNERLVTCFFKYFDANKFEDDTEEIALALEILESINQ